MNNTQLVVKMVFGSRLYGLHTENSDTDYKGVFMPTKRELLLQRVPKSIHTSTKADQHTKSTATDVEEELYSLNYFVELACAGETVALDMLHAPESALLNTSPEWHDLVKNRDKFYTKNLKAFVGYARKQAAKYGVKGSRLNDVERVLQFFLTIPTGMRVADVWDELPTGDHIFKTKNKNGELYEVCGKKVNPLAEARHYVPMLEKFMKEYGERARLAADNKGVDWKAMSHAFRAGIQVMHILEHGGYTYPLPESSFLLCVKRGEYEFHRAAELLDQLLDTLEGLSARSTLPEQVDRTFWDNWLLNALENAK